MIKNHDELLRTQQQCIDFQRTIDETIRRLEKESLTSEMIDRATAPMRSYLQGLQEEIAAYEQDNPDIRSIDDLLDNDEGKAELDAHCQAVGQKLKVQRMGAGYTRYQLADHSGIPEHMIAQIELGQYSPTAKTIIQLAQALDIEPRFLMDGV